VGESLGWLQSGGDAFHSNFAPVKGMESFQLGQVLNCFGLCRFPDITTGPAISQDLIAVGMEDGAAGYFYNQSAAHFSFLARLPQDGMCGTFSVPAILGDWMFETFAGCGSGVHLQAFSASSGFLFY
jgi:hypothetical protein